MALITRSASASMDISTAQFAPQLPGLTAGEALTPCSPCYIDTDGLVYLSNGTANDKEAQIAGFTPHRSYVSGEGGVTLFGEGTRYKYGTGLTPGAQLYLGATNGRLDGAATVGDAVGCARVVSTTDIVIMRTRPTLAASSAINASNLDTVADKAVVGGVDFVFRVDLAAGAIGDTDVVSTHKIRVLDAWLVLRGAGVANCVIAVKNGATAITDAMAASGADKALVRCATLDDAAWEIAAAGTLRVTSSVGASQPVCTVFIRAIRVA
jgi:hypothetical protein